MKLRNATRVAITALALLALGGPAVATAEAAEAPACAAEQVTYLDAEDTAHAAHDKLGNSEAALKGPQEDQAKLDKAVMRGRELVAAFELDGRSPEEVSKAVQEAEAAATRHDPEGTANAIKRAAEWTKDFIAKSPRKDDLVKIEAAANRAREAADEARGAVKAKELGTLKSQFDQAQKDDENADKALTGARAKLKECLRKAIDTK
ncbi:hypothetical protein ACIG3E_22650 [Streptomyces sp. NPDC053474]|uniref:hypothetical protein n=1 Tax=Streptomyces sp. NPDC053474 TaxID=3365704 RepID=UPI0037D66C25